MRTLLVCACAVLAAVMIIGCAASTTEQAEKPTPATSIPQAPPPAKETSAQVDTVSVAVQKAQKPAYESTNIIKTEIPPSSVVKYCVQIGAYKLRENADLVAAVAKSRFAMNVYTIREATTDLYKVMVGEFSTKDDARAFRDRMVQQYPGEYKDAWVSELAH